MMPLPSHKMIWKYQSRATPHYNSGLPGGPGQALNWLECRGPEWLGNKEAKKKRAHAHTKPTDTERAGVAFRGEAIDFTPQIDWPEKPQCRTVA